MLGPQSPDARFRLARLRLNDGAKLWISFKHFYRAYWRNMGDDIGSDMLSMFVCFDFCSTDIGSSVIGTHTSTNFDVINH